MIKQGTLFTIDGLQFVVIEHKVIGSQHLVRAEPFIVVKDSIKEATDELFNKIKLEKSAITISEMITTWFLRCKAILLQNANMLISVKQQLFALELRRLHREGESWEEIINVLLFSLDDKFWADNLLKCYKNLASKNTRSGIPIYQQLKSIILSHSDDVVKVAGDKKLEDDL